MKIFLKDLAESLGVLALLAIFCGIAYQDKIWPPAKVAAPVFRPYNGHWQSNIDKKMMICYQKMATIPEVKHCLHVYGAFI